MPSMPCPFPVGRRIPRLLILCLAVVAGGLAGTRTMAAEAPRIVLETSLGKIVLELDGERAPHTTANFIRYVQAGLYNGASFYRTVTDRNQPNDRVRIAVIQGGLGPEDDERSFAPIAMESTASTGILHLDGTLSMARNGPDTATGEFFICVGDQQELDFGGQRNPDGVGFAAFGRVVEGMGVVRSIHQSPEQAQRLDPVIAILKAWVVE